MTPKPQLLLPWQAYTEPEGWDSSFLSGLLLDLTIGLQSLRRPARALSQMVRWGGRLNYPFTVLEHTHFCYQLAYDKLGWKGPEVLFLLLHDLHEPLCGDVAGPCKTPQFRKLEAWLQGHVCRLLDVPTPTMDQLRAVDMVDRFAAFCEREAFGTTDSDWGLYVYDLHPEPLDHADGHLTRWCVQTLRTLGDATPDEILQWHATLQTWFVSMVNIWIERMPTPTRNPEPLEEPNA